MIGTAAAIGLGLAGAGSIISSKSQSKAANKAVDVSYQTAAMNNALAQNIYNQNAQRLDPYAQQGLGATNQLNALLGIGGDPTKQREAFDVFRNSTGYNFLYDQMLDSTRGSFSGAGVGQSGAAQKALQDRAMSLADTSFNNYAGLLANQQGVGLSGASALAGVGQNYANSVMANNNSAGSAAANAALYKGANNPLANAIGLLGGGLYGMAR